MEKSTKPKYRQEQDGTPLSIQAPGDHYLEKHNQVCKLQSACARVCDSSKMQKSTAVIKVDAQMARAC